jgi:SAM-dependent methyltransferase
MSDTNGSFPDARSSHEQEGSTTPDTQVPATAGQSYADRLNTLQGKKWKKWLNVQAPYRANLRRYKLGRTLDVGCGNGRNLGALPTGSVGVDHNAELVGSARKLGLDAYTVDEFFANKNVSAPASYDAILAAHLIEHLQLDEARSVMTSYLPLLRPGGRVVFITPQERGYASDPTHVVFADFAELSRLSEDLGLTTTRQYSFPFPRSMGKLFIYNEFNQVAELPAG